MDSRQRAQAMREFAADVVARYNAGEALDDPEESMARHLGLPPRVQHPDNWEQCSVCGGTGYDREDSCSACEGQGGYTVAL